MTQLMMWKRDGKWECGWQSSEENFLLSINPNRYSQLTPKFAVTDLQKAKAVPLDEITISKLSFLRLTDDSGITDTFTSAEYRRGLTAHRLYCEQVILSENPHLIKPEPMKEPTNFAAVVEASYFEYTGQKTWGRFFLNGKNWILQGTLSSFQFRELINPVLISEGVVGEK